jgi:hypothetical protein
MARYNTVVSSTTTSAASATVGSPSSGAFTEFTGSTTAVTIGDPALFTGGSQTFFNNTASTVTLTSGGSGQFIGPGGSSGSTFAMTTGTVLVVTSDGTYWVVNGAGIGPHAVTTLSASGAVTLTPASANITISPSGTGTVAISPSGTGALTINPNTLSTMNNVTIGGTTAAAGTFTSLTATGAASLTGGITLQQITEVLNTKTGATGVVTHDYSTGDLWYHSSISANFTPNFTNMPTTANRTVAITLILNQGSSGYYPSAVQVNGAGVTLRWANNVTPTPGVSKFDTAAFTFIYTGSTWYCLGQYTSFA